MPAGLQSTTNAFTGSSFIFSKNILDNQFSFSAYVNNPFNQFRKAFTETIGNDFLPEQLC